MTFQNLKQNDVRDVNKVLNVMMFEHFLNGSLICTRVIKRNHHRNAKPTNTHKHGYFDTTQANNEVVGHLDNLIRQMRTLIFQLSKDFTTLIKKDAYFEAGSDRENVKLGSLHFHKAINRHANIMNSELLPQSSSNPYTTKRTASA